MGNCLHRAGDGSAERIHDASRQASVSLTYVTGTLVKVGQEIGKAVCGKGQGFGWALQGAMWPFLLAGATTGAALLMPLQSYGTWPLAALALLLSGVALAHLTR